MPSLFRTYCLYSLLFLLACTTPFALANSPSSANLPRASSSANSSPTTSDAVNLQPHFIEGSTLRYEIWTLRQRKMVSNDQSFEMRYEINGEMTWKVKQVNDDGSAQCEMTIDWLTLTLTLPNGKTQFNDSREGSGDAELVHQQLQAMTGVALDVQMASDGSVISVVGTDAMKENAPEGVQVPSNLDFMETASDLVTLPFAPAAATPKQTWKTAFDWSHELGSIHYDTTNELKGIEEISGQPIAIIQSTSTLELKVDQEKIESQGPAIHFDLIEGSASTQILFDLTRHEAVGRNTTLKTKIEMSMQVAGQDISQTTTETIQGQALRIAENAQ